MVYDIDDNLWVQQDAAMQIYFAAIAEDFLILSCMTRALPLSGLMIAI